MTEITTKEYINDKIKLHNLYVIGDMLTRMSETVKIATDELEDEFRESEEMLDVEAIHSIVYAVKSNLDTILYYLCKLER